MKKSNTKSSPSRSAYSSGSSSSNRRPPTGQLVSHRGPGSTPNTPRISHVNSAQDVNAVDSSIEPVSLHQHLHSQHTQSYQDQSDHRAVYLDQRQLHVGLDPQQVHARETSIIAQANAAVHETRERVHIIENQAQQFAMHVQSEAQSVVQESQREAQQAQNEARSVEHRAYGLIEEMKERHRQESGRVQDVAQEAVASSQKSLAKPKKR